MITGIIVMATSAGAGATTVSGTTSTTGAPVRAWPSVWCSCSDRSPSSSASGSGTASSLGRTGQSVGKKIAGQKLINTTSGQPIGAGQSFVREVIHGLANQVVYLSYLWMLWDSNRQTLGDMVAKSTVIKVPG